MPVIDYDKQCIDVSEWQGKPDWSLVSTVKSFALIRYADGLSIDEQVERNVREAYANGMRIGLWVYSYPNGNADRPIQEAKKMCEYANSVREKITMPIFFDLEEGNEGTQTREFVQQCAVNFCETVKSYGFTPGVYYNGDYNARYYGNDFWAEHPDYVKWFAFPDSGETSQDYDIWQYSWVGRVPGISTDVDLDVIGDSPIPPTPPTPHPVIRKFPIMFYLRRRR